VDTDVFRPLPEIKRQHYVLSVGAIQHHKGFDFLIQSLGMLPNATRPALRLVGNVEICEERRSLEAFALQHKVELHIEVGIGQDVLVRRYNEAALLAYAPYDEPFGLVPLEAMACGTPVVGVAEGGVRESIVDGVTGLHVERDCRAFAGAIGRLFGESELRAVFGRNARDYVLKHWTWGAAIDRLERQLQDVAAGPNPAKSLALPPEMN